MRLLVSVRSVEEALIAAGEGVDFIDLKNPSAGALGGLPIPTIRRIVAALRGESECALVSATVGDHAAAAGEQIAARVRAVAECGVDLVKVGVPGRGGPEASALLDALLAAGHPVVPVLIADQGIEPEFFARVCALPFAAVMIDTQTKHGDNLLQMLPRRALESLILHARGANRLFGIAGALQVGDVPALQLLDPDFAGFRSAVCAGSRTASLSVERLRLLRAAIQTRETALPV